MMPLAPPIGQVELSVVIGTHSITGVQTVVVNVERATELRSADTFGSNDVYVQMYEIHADTPDPTKTEPLPKP